MAGRPELIGPPPAQSVQRGALGVMGLKVEPNESYTGIVMHKAREFLRRNNLEKTTGWMQVQTDEPGYTKLRKAIRNDDWVTAKNILTELRKNRSDGQIDTAMRAWSQRGFTGAAASTENYFFRSLTDEEKRMYDQAMLEKAVEVEKWRDFIRRTP